jgi:transcription-repair coupling factor (superfamily II helicase)
MSTLTNEARKRLTAIEQFSELGSGFNIAMRDLDIRGAGNLLGGEQSGFITDIGYETYQKILEEAMEELKETAFKGLFEEDKEREYVSDCQLETDLEVLIPDDYINNITERMSIYRQLAEVEEEQDLISFQASLEDRFGPITEPVQTLLQSKRLIWAGKKMGLEKVVFKSKKVIGYFIAEKQSKYFESPRFEKVLQFVQSNPNRVQLRERNERLSIVFNPINNLDHAIEALSAVMES